MFVVTLIATACIGPDASPDTGAEARGASARMVPGGCEPGGLALEERRVFVEPRDVVSLSLVRDIAVGADGTVYALEAQARTVIAYDSDGRLRWTFGREGDGPGEFRWPRSLWTLRDGRIAVGSSSPPQISYFGADGRFLDRFRLDVTPVGPTVANIVAEWKAHPAGAVFAGLRMYAMVYDSVPYRVVGVTEDGSVSDTLFRWNLPPVASADEKVVLWQPQWVWTPGPDDRVAASPGHSYEIRLQDRLGTLERVLARDIQAIAVTPAIRVRLRRGYFAQMAERGEPALAQRQARERLESPETLPVIDGLWWAVDGGTIVARILSPNWQRDWPFQWAWDLWSDAGDFLGCVPEPEGARLRLVRGDTFYTVHYDALDVPGIRTYVLTEER